MSSTSIEAIPPIRGRERIMMPLVGVNAISTHRIRRQENGEPCYVFAFPDLSVRQEGFYCLHFCCYEIDGADIIPRASVKSNTFRVYSAKEFPGMGETTALTQVLKSFGIRVKCSKSIRARVKRSNEVIPCANVTYQTEIRRNTGKRGFLR